MLFIQNYMHPYNKFIQFCCLRFLMGTTICMFFMVKIGVHNIMKTRESAGGCCDDGVFMYFSGYCKNMVLLKTLPLASSAALAKKQLISTLPEHFYALQKTFPTGLNNKHIQMYSWH